MSEDAKVRLWGRTIGAVSLEEGMPAAVFQYEPAFAASGIEVAPLTMPLRTEPYSFPALDFETFKGLPGLLADSLPDKYGNALIDTWLAAQGRSAESASAIERLCYTGTRGMGALEFEPARGPEPSAVQDIQVEALVKLASEVLTERDRFVASVREGHEEEGLRELLSVGTSAGGARAKAVIAWNSDTDEIRSGQVAADPGFEHWLLKFDGVSGNRDKERLDDPEGYGAIEFAYSRMAAAAGVEMAARRLLGENGRRHFMTRRFDRPMGDRKLHMQSLGALAHYDFNQAGAYSYEQALMAIRRVGLTMADLEQQFRRAAFNVIARNQDDHVKNIAFLMDRSGEWSLAPAFDLTFAYNRAGDWTAQQQMTLNGKRDDFTLEDFERCAEAVSMKRRAARAIVEEVLNTVLSWRSYADEVGIPEPVMEKVAAAHRVDLLNA